jgi:hypothetical protein
MNNYGFVFFWKSYCNLGIEFFTTKTLKSPNND